MKANVNFLKVSDLASITRKLRESSMYGTINTDDRGTYEKIAEDQEGQVLVSVLPPVESIKGFLFPAKERVAVYPSDNEQGGLDDNSAAQVIMGARACDLCALTILDKIFLEQDVADPFYKIRRDNTLLITTDCGEIHETCFCHLVDGKPYPKNGFDINFSPVTDGYLVEVGTEKGQAALDQFEAILRQASPEQIKQRDNKRAEVLEQLKLQNKEFKKKIDPAKISDNKAAEIWAYLSARCVECGACNFICPTCHCFFLYDQPQHDSPDHSERQKTWDSCLLSNYAKMAGVGGMKPTPRPEVRSRFENRVRHKFDWMPSNLQLFGCVGCGRCIEACLADLDIRDVFKEFGR